MDKIKKVVDEAYYAMIGGNIIEEDIDYATVASWFDLIYHELKQAQQKDSPDPDTRQDEHRKPSDYMPSNEGDIGI